jgi:hypothetical protein
MYKFISYSQCYKRDVTLQKSHHRQLLFIELIGTTAYIIIDVIYEQQKGSTDRQLQLNLCRLSS